MAQEAKYKILIVDDSEMNRTILADILCEKFEIMEAEDGVEAIQKIRQYKNEISLILLDLVMPNMDGLEVLALMNRYDWIDDIPVIMISAETSPTYIERAYELGVTDFISRPFNVFVVRKRVANTIMLYAKQKGLVDLVNRQIYEKVRTSDMMLNILSHVVEFRNGESGLHILHVNTITEVLLKRLLQKTDKYTLTPEDIETIVIASSLHDIGKIAIPDAVLNKPGRLDEAEFEIIKRHPQTGADMLGDLVDYADEPLVRFARDICLYHHERYDGSGYPCGLKGDEIPIYAQVVSIADVYDALTSERCYKNAIPHHEAIRMICDGECGAFDPLLLECLTDVQEILARNLQLKSPTRKNMLEIKAKTDEMLRQSQFSIVNNSLNYLEQERIKNEFYASLSQEIQYEHTASPFMITISEWSADKFGLPQMILDPREHEKLLQVLGGRETFDLFLDAMQKTSPEHPVTQFGIQLCVDGAMRHHRVYCRVNWSTEGERKIVGSIGKIMDIEDEYRRMQSLEKSASIDTLTEIFNRGHAEKFIRQKLADETQHRFALILFDVDDFKIANDTYGHSFGDMVLRRIADVLRIFDRKDSIAARVGGDEFLLFLCYEEDSELQDFLRTVCTGLQAIDCGAFSVSLSKGVATTTQQAANYEVLFNCADAALYHSKRSAKGSLTYYTDDMDKAGLSLTPIEN